MTTGRSGRSRGCAPSLATRVASRRASFIRDARRRASHTALPSVVIPLQRRDDNPTVSIPNSFNPIHVHSDRFTEPFALRRARTPRPALKFQVLERLRSGIHISCVAVVPAPEREREREKENHETSVPAARETRSSIFQIVASERGRIIVVEPRDEKDPPHGVTLHRREGHRRVVRLRSVFVGGSSGEPKSEKIGKMRFPICRCLMFLTRRPNSSRPVTR